LRRSLRMRTVNPSFGTNCIDSFGCGAANMEMVHSGNAVGGASPGKLQFSAEAVSALHTALGDGSGNHDPISSPAFNDALWQICSEAKLKDWRPESLLIAFKTTLETVPAVRRLARGPDRDEFVARLVSRFIVEYYRDARRSACDRDRSIVGGERNTIAHDPSTQRARHVQWRCAQKPLARAPLGSVCDAAWPLETCVGVASCRVRAPSR
jgi:hypothetical protein